MAVDLRCPNCRSENVIFSRKKAAYFCEDCGHVLPDDGPLSPPPAAPLRIFLSYGHDHHEELARLICADLEKRDHHVWIDRSEIKAGDDWRRRITEGIVESQRVLSILSKHSTRDPGVCRDEIAIAIGVKGGNIHTILVESEEEVQPPVNIGHIQWLDMHDWKERRAHGGETWERWYKEKRDEILRVVESAESRRFAGEIESLNQFLKPIRSEARIGRLLGKGYYGREWLFEEVERWRRNHRGDSRLMWIKGWAGVGKSAFAAQLAYTRSDAVIAAQFCEWDKPDHRDAQRVVCSLVFQLATRLSDYRKLLLTLPELDSLERKTADELFDYLLANPLKSAIGGSRDRYLIVLDAIDEARDGENNPLVEMLARNADNLPDWIGIVATSRPDYDVAAALQALRPVSFDAESESNRNDLRDYLWHELAVPLHDRPDADYLVEEILEKSEGLFLYIERFCEDIRVGNLSLDRPEEFPRGLGGKLLMDFKRYFPDVEKFRRDVCPALRAILAAREPLPLDLLQRLLDWNEEELQTFIRPLAALFPVTNDTGQQTIKPFHKSLIDWLTDSELAGDYFASALEGHRLLADLGWTIYDRGAGTLEGYLRRHLPRHLCEAGNPLRLVSLLSDRELLHS